ncbi:hypothetical protein [Companilactobacillus mishanensis]|uniref:Integral membrane protein n=1 Tax=Companilactobacillus mishanensis TaxID=2486008 RepID=A0ABW9P3P3_9LACO|nr:hypothetical protein [Companilactobacillus mishanensis]MQS43888.1 hypothetical protein [Companilactobacillus mishanensis]
MEFWNDYLRWIVGTVLVFTAVPYFTALIASWLGHVSKGMLVNNLGPNSQLVVGGLGVAIHESGHALFAIIFGHKVTKIQLLNFHYAQNGTLGSVEHSWRENNIYQRLGNFFIGLAPYYMCSIALYLLQKFLLGTTFDFSGVLQSTDIAQFTSLSKLATSVFDNFMTIFANASWGMIIFYLVLLIMISSTGYDLSDEDFNTVKKGLLPWGTVLLLLSTLAVMFGWQIQLLNWMSVMIVFSVLFLVQALIYILVSLVVIRILSLVIHV